VSSRSDRRSLLGRLSEPGKCHSGATIKDVGKVGFSDPPPQTTTLGLRPGQRAHRASSVSVDEWIRRRAHWTVVVALEAVGIVHVRFTVSSGPITHFRKLQLLFVLLCSGWRSRGGCGERGVSPPGYGQVPFVDSITGMCCPQTTSELLPRGHGQLPVSQLSSGAPGLQSRVVAGDGAEVSGAVWGVVDATTARDAPIGVEELAPARASKTPAATDAIRKKSAKSPQESNDDHQSPIIQPQVSGHIHQ
jgi:hypothetical protein